MKLKEGKKEQTERDRERQRETEREEEERTRTKVHSAKIGSIQSKMLRPHP